MIGLLVLGATVSIVSATDPCSQVCDAIPGACGPDGSRCVDEICTDLFWYDGALCNSSMPGCPNRFPLMCRDALILMGEGDHLGVVAHAPRRFVSFAPGRSVGRRGFQRIDSTTSLFSSILQVALHSRSLRSAIVDDVELGRPGPTGDGSIYSAAVGLLNRMYEDQAAAAAERGPLDLSEFKHAFEDFWGLEDDEGNRALRTLVAFMHEMAQASEGLTRALTLEARSAFGDWSIPRAVEFVPFPARLSNRSRWSIKEMLVVHFEVPEEQIHFEVPEEQIGITRLPELLSIAISRYPDSPTERVNSYVETPMEIDFSGILADGEAHKYRLVGIVREIGRSFVADYFDSDTNEWIHANDSHLHVIQGQPRNGGADAVMVFYERL